MKYKVSRTCKNCGNVEETILTKVEAAFELYDSRAIWNQACTACGSKECKSISSHTPSLDEELLDIWGNDPELFFWQQDQELFLAEYDYFPLLLNAIDKSNYPKAKIDVLIEAICILLYDNTYPSQEFSKEEMAEREAIADKVRPELIKRKERIKQAGDWVMEYIQEVVYPQIGIERTIK